MDDHDVALVAKFAIFCGVAGLVFRHFGFGDEETWPFWMAIAFIVYGAYELPLPNRDNESPSKSDNSN